MTIYEKLGVPPPKLAPEERQRRRLVWRNEHFLYRSKCHICEASIITMYPPECSFPVLCAECFWSDKFDPSEYGRDFDFHRGFFPQWAELHAEVPQLALFQAKSVNSEYTMNSINNKNCYMTSGADFNEDCLYGLNTQRSKDCVDHILLYDSSLCYGCTYSSKLYNCIGIQDSDNCSDSLFLFDCKGCRSCAFSSNLRNREFVFENKELSREQYNMKLAETLKKLFESPYWLYENMERMRINAIRRANFTVNCENVSGNYIRNSKNSFDVYDAENLEDCQYCYYALSMKDAQDASCAGWGRLSYETISSGNTDRVIFSSSIIDSHDIFYSRAIWNCSDLFGCISMKNHQSHMILNKKYPQEEYSKFKMKIIKHMQRTGEWGEFFPPAIAPFEYNRSLPGDHMPLTKEEAVSRGFRWYDKKENTNPISHLCWPCRVVRLIHQREPYRLLDSSCTKCGVHIRTPISQNSNTKIYCEKCYLETVY